MKKILFFMLLLACTTMAMAQKNLREGYVITLQGDTLRGVIDFRTISMNMKRCVFKEDGATEFKTYLPGEIEGYRFTNNGIYYITRNVTKEDNTNEMIFAEYVLQGNMNLYQISTDEMLLEDEEGNLASFSLEKAKEAATPKELREELQDVLKMLNKSGTATNILMKNSKNRSNTKRAVKAYVDEVCTDGYCEAFEYKSKSTPKEDRLFHPWVKAGFKTTKYQFWDGRENTIYAPQFSAGADFHLNRVLKGLMATAGFTFENASLSRDVNDLFAGEPSAKLNGSETTELDFSQFDIMYGLGYQLQTGPVKSHVKVGGIFRLASHRLEDTMAIYKYRGKDYDNHITIVDEELKFDTGSGFFGGIGVEYPLKRFSLVCDVEYIYDSNNGHLTYNGETRKNETTDLDQHGFCLSVGVKF